MNNSQVLRLTVQSPKVASVEISSFKSKVRLVTTKVFYNECGRTWGYETEKINRIRCWGKNFWIFENSEFLSFCHRRQLRPQSPSVNLRKSPNADSICGSHRAIFIAVFERACFTFSIANSLMEALFANASFTNAAP